MNLPEFWDTKVLNGHKHFVGAMSREKVNRLQARVKRHFLDQIGLNNGNSNDNDKGVVKKVIDWGCGGGLHTKTLSLLFKRVVPIDISQKSLDTCEKYAGVKGLLLPENVESFDLRKIRGTNLIWCADVIHHFPSFDYFKCVCKVWNRISPTWLCLQFKLSDEIKDRDNYYEGQGYLHSLMLPKEKVIEQFPGYEEVYFGTEKSKFSQIRHGFLVLKRISK